MTEADARPIHEGSGVGLLADPSPLGLSDGQGTAPTRSWLGRTEVGRTGGPSKPLLTRVYTVTGPLLGRTVGRWPWTSTRRPMVPGSTVVALTTGTGGSLSRHDGPHDPGSRGPGALPGVDSPTFYLPHPQSTLDGTTQVPVTPSEVGVGDVDRGEGRPTGGPAIPGPTLVDTPTELPPRTLRRCPRTATG